MFSYRIDKAQGIIFTNISESISTVDMMAHIQKILGDADFQANYHTIAKIEAETVFPEISPDEIELLNTVFKGYAEKRKESKWAIVVSGEIKQKLVEDNLALILPEGSARIRIFRNESDALQWIKNNGY